LRRNMDGKDLQNKDIMRFWDKRAEEYGESWKATLGEKYLRMLEIKTMIKFIKLYNPMTVLDAGCGNGYSTKIYARKFPKIDFSGIDYSELMILHTKKTLLKNCKFFIGDVLQPDTLPKKTFDMVMTQRCIQNITDYTSQYNAIKNLLSKVSEGGHLLLMECSKDGVQKLNQLRVKFGEKIQNNIEPWHNNFFDDKRLTEDFKAHIFHFSSTYMFLSRVIYPRLPLLGYILPPIGCFGYDKLYIIKK
jgi:ubiquinone/menaquinone biosynthesis C-methylase UbiE